MAIPKGLRDDVMKLPPEERLELAEQLYESLSPESDPDWERAWSDEIKRRMEDIRAGRVELVDADTVHAELLELVVAKQSR
jgi:putative addiction module component (TIGR02574 family)